MKFQVESPQGHHAITSYGPGYVIVSGQIYHGSLVVGHDRLEATWPVTSIDMLAPEHLEGFSRNCDVLLLGTGKRQRFPDRRLLKPLLEKHVGVEVMDTSAACRTYNLLLAEGRAVVAALIVE